MPIDPEKLLWELSGLPEDEDAPIVDDQTLQDFHKGRLGAGQAEQVERLLAGSRQARMRLEELSGLAPARPSPQLRHRVLASLPARRLGWFRWQRAALAVAATLLIILAAQLFWLNAPSPSPASLPDYQIRVFAAAELRSPDSDTPQQGAAQIYRVDSQTRVRIEISARGAASDQVGYGLYRLAGDRLAKLDASQGVTLRDYRGAAAFEAAGSGLAPQPGRWQLYALVASRGRLPDGLTLNEGEDPEAKLREFSAGQVFSIQFEVLADGDAKNE